MFEFLWTVIIIAMVTLGVLIGVFAFIMLIGFFVVDSSDRRFKKFLKQRGLNK